MNLKSKFEKILVQYLKIAHISIYIEKRKFHLHIKIVKGKKVLFSESRIFDVMSGGEVPKLMSDYLAKIYKQVAYGYVSTVLQSINQGFTEDCSDGTIVQRGIDINTLAKVCLEDKWTLYAPHTEIEKVQESFKGIYGVDYIFPMANLIEHLRSHDTSEKAIMYVFNTRTSASLAIYKEDRLIYNAQFLYVSRQELENDIDSEDEESDDLAIEDDSDFDISEEGSDDDLDDLDFGDDGGLDDLDDLDGDLSDDSLDDFALEDNDVSLEDFDPDNPDGTSESTDADDMQKEVMLFEFIDKSVNDFYKSPDHGSDFITECFIYDSCRCSVGLKKHIKEIFLVDPKVMSVDLGETMCELSIEEAKLDDVKI
ncbi:MAG: hypothetical protein OIF32_03420 [Campylobacterales bacterium]|nr:hypothetical protein [Campylobacterales bacterium]